MDKINSLFIQIQGPFKGGSENPISFNEMPFKTANLQNISIQSCLEFAPGLPADDESTRLAVHRIHLGKLGTFVLGGTGILEMRDLNLIKSECESFYFLQDEPASTIIDLVFY